MEKWTNYPNGISKLTGISEDIGMKQDNDIDYSRKHDLTIGEIKACPLFQHLTDQQALEVIETLKIFTKITYDVHKKDTQNKGKTIENSYLENTINH